MIQRAGGPGVRGHPGDRARRHPVVRRRVSAHLPPGDPGSTVDWDALARLGGTLVLLMARRPAGRGLRRAGGGRPLRRDPGGRRAGRARCRRSAPSSPRSRAAAHDAARRARPGRRRRRRGRGGAGARAPSDACRDRAARRRPRLPRPGLAGRRARRCWRAPPRCGPGCGRRRLRRQRLAVDPRPRCARWPTRASTTSWSLPLLLTPASHSKTDVAASRAGRPARAPGHAAALRPAARPAPGRWSTCWPAGWPRRARATTTRSCWSPAGRSTRTPTRRSPRPRGCCWRAGAWPSSTSPSPRRPARPCPRRWSGCARSAHPRVAVARYFLGPGYLPRLVEQQARAVEGLDVVVTDAARRAPTGWPGCCSERYDEALRGDLRMNCDVCLYRVPLPGREARGRRGAGAARPPGRPAGVTRLPG